MKHKVSSLRSQGLQAKPRKNTHTIDRETIKKLLDLTKRVNKHNKQEQENIE